MGEQTPLTKNSPKFASLRVTLPISIVKQWGLKEGDKLDWSWKVLDGKMVLVVDKTDNSSSYNMDRRSNWSEQQQPKQLEQRQQHNNKKQKAYNQLMKLVSRAAYRATKK
jgi:hypothetical protein